MTQNLNTYLYIHKILPCLNVLLYSPKTKIDNHRKNYLFKWFSSLNAILKIPCLLQIDLFFFTNFLINIANFGRGGFCENHTFLRQNLLPKKVKPNEKKQIEEVFMILKTIFRCKK